MTRNEKIHEMNIVYNKLKNVLDDTDEDLWAHHHLEEALLELEDWFEESDI